METTHRTATLSAGMLDYRDRGGDGPTVLLCHGLLMNHTVWQPVVELLSGVRVVVPDLPLGGHRTPLDPRFDMSFAGLVDLFDEFVALLGLRTSCSSSRTRASR